MSKQIPLAHRVRPAALEGFIGHEEARTFLTDFLAGQRRSVIIWGPPGTGKTTLANIIAQHYKGAFFSVSAVTSGVKELREVTSAAQGAEIAPIVFIDEIHRFNRTQQDALLPFVEDGTIVLIGVTTENPSFALNSPLLSRLQVIALKRLDKAAIATILRRAFASDEQLQSLKRELAPECLEAIAGAADGDARAGLNLLELVLDKVAKPVIELNDLKALIDRPLYHDRAGEQHYDLISAFHKSVRASDVDGSVYWLGRMLEAGEDRLYVLRRMIRIASEDVGLAEPGALRFTLEAKAAFESLGQPEGDLAIYQAAVYLACAPKSNAVYLTEKRVKKLIRESGAMDVPLYLRNAPTKLMRELGYNKGYIYAHDDPVGAAQLDYLPAGLGSRNLYEPTDHGFEKRIKEVMDGRSKLKRARKD